MVEHGGERTGGLSRDPHLTAPLRARARALGDSGGINLWAGQAYKLAIEATAGEIIERWKSDLARLERG